MDCPKCDNDKTLVKNSRVYMGDTYRQRKCNECGYMFFTREQEFTDSSIITDAMYNAPRRHYKELKMSK